MICNQFTSYNVVMLNIIAKCGNFLCYILVRQNAHKQRSIKCIWTTGPKILKQAYFWNLAKGSNLALTSPPRFNIWNENEVGIF